MKLYDKYLLCLILSFSMLNHLWGQCKTLCAGGTITATTSGFTTSLGDIQTYVLVNTQSGLIANVSTSGVFNGVATGNYHVHALNYNAASIPSPFPSIGLDITSVGVINAGCMNPDFQSDFRCFEVKDCNCTPRTICVGQNVQISASLYTTTNSAQVYYLVNPANGLIIATNITGNFTANVSAGNSYQVYALNYDLTNPPSPLPSVGLSCQVVGTSVMGCYNDDFLTDFQCIKMEACTCSDICQGTNISATTTGFTVSPAQHLYVLADASNGLILNTNTSGTFASSSLIVGDVYNVHAINYDINEPPIPMAAVGELVSNVGGVSKGCFNSDFATDIKCFKVIACPLPVEWLKLNGYTQGENNILQWEDSHNQDIAFYELQRSSNNNEFVPVLKQSPHSISLYSQVDDSPLNGINFYKVKAILSNGGMYESNIVQLFQQNALDFQLFPNPFQSGFTIQAQGNQQGVKWELFNALGQSVLQIKFDVEGIYQQEINVSQLSNGLYFYSLKDENGKPIKRGKLIKEG